MGSIVDRKYNMDNEPKLWYNIAFIYIFGTYVYRFMYDSILTPHSTLNTPACLWFLYILFTQCDLPTVLAIQLNTPVS